MPDLPKPATALLAANQQIELPGAIALEIMREIEFMLISLRKISDHHLYTPMDNFDKTVTDFVYGARFPQRLAKVRALLSERFDNSLGEDDQGDVERYVEDLEFWTPNDLSKP
jgi:hypothetical protein